MTPPAPFARSRAANLLDKDGQIIDGGKALTTDSLSSVFSGTVGAAPAAVYIESAAGTAAGGKTGLTAITVGVLFLLILFLSPLSYRCRRMLQRPR